MDRRHETLQWCFYRWRIPILVIRLGVKLLNNLIDCFSLSVLFLNLLSSNCLTSLRIIYLNSRVFFSCYLVTLFCLRLMTNITLFLLFNWLLQSTSERLIKLNFLNDFLFTFIVLSNLSICGYQFEVALYQLLYVRLNFSRIFHSICTLINWLLLMRLLWQTNRVSLFYQPINFWCLVIVTNVYVYYSVATLSCDSCRS